MTKDELLDKAGKCLDDDSYYIILKIVEEVEYFETNYKKGLDKEGILSFLNDPEMMGCIGVKSNLQVSDAKSFIQSLDFEGVGMGYE